MDDIDRVVHDALTEWPDHEDFFVEWHRFVHGPLAQATWSESEQDQLALGLTHRQHR